MDAPLIDCEDTFQVAQQPKLLSGIVTINQFHNNWNLKNFQILILASV